MKKTFTPFANSMDLIDQGNKLPQAALGGALITARIEWLLALFCLLTVHILNIRCLNAGPI